METKDKLKILPAKIKIEHLEGPSKGFVYELRRDIALELIREKKARETQ